uniref:Zinc finger PHD-type domain-containing protein n=1 Tax=Palpitomonas bilix TaxID=652834 RepID=A0A7S3D2L4_9EUKA
MGKGARDIRTAKKEERQKKELLPEHKDVDVAFSAGRSNSNSEKSDDDDQGEGDTRCVCKQVDFVDDDDIRFMVQCSTCEKWLHAFCIGIEDEKDVPEVYQCPKCFKAAERNERKRKRAEQDMQEPSAQNLTREDRKMQAIMRQIQINEEREEREKQRKRTLGETPGKMKKKTGGANAWIHLKSPQERKRMRLLDLSQYENGFVPLHKRFAGCAGSQGGCPLGPLFRKKGWEEDAKSRFLASSNMLQYYILDGCAASHDFDRAKKLLSPKKYMAWIEDRSLLDKARNPKMTKDKSSARSTAIKVIYFSF